MTSYDHSTQYHTLHITTFSNSNNLQKRKEKTFKILPIFHGYTCNKNGKIVIVIKNGAPKMDGLGSDYNGSKEKFVIIFFCEVNKLSKIANTAIKRFKIEKT